MMMKLAQILFLFFGLLLAAIIFSRLYRESPANPEGIASQKAAFEDRGLSVNLLGSAKLVALEVNYDEADFGLETEVAEDVRPLFCCEAS